MKIHDIAKKYKNKSVIYLLVNPKNQKYIGATNNLGRRLNFHKSSKRSGLLYESISKFGFYDHEISVLWSCDKSNEKLLYEMEEFYIKKENTCYLDNPEFGLNMRRSINDNEWMIGKNEAIKKIYKYDLLTGVFIKEFSSIHEAARYLNKKGGYKNISAAAYGKRRYAYGFYWSFEKHDLYKPEMCWKNKKKQDVYKLYKDGTVIYAKYDSISEAANKNNTTSTEMFLTIKYNRILNDKYIFIKVA